MMLFMGVLKNSPPSTLLDRESDRYCEMPMAGLPGQESSAWWKPK